MQKCDLRRECENESSKLRKLVDTLDLKSGKELRLIEGNIYQISDLMSINLA